MDWWHPSAPSGGSLGNGSKVAVTAFNASAADPFPANMTTSPFGYPSPDRSWLKFTNAIRIRPQDSTSELKPLPPAEIDPADLNSQTNLLQQSSLGISSQLGLGIVGGSPGFTPQTPVPSASVAPIPASPPPTVPPLAMTSLPTDVYDNVDDLPTPEVEVRCAPTTYVYLIGMAIRAGYPINPPSLVSVGGIQAVPANDESCFVDQGTGAVWGGVPIQICRWKLRWLVLGLANGAALPSTVMA